MNKNLFEKMKIVFDIKLKNFGNKIEFVYFN